ncbi:MAG: putative toxin-antitoxin system toxin component, PIN family [Bacteroidetes bacterium]|nr:putative toxin-antitoxin system toxin component, PIN family [Bacteroidota bacterium]
MRVALDTNILVSALVTRGLSTDVIRLVLAKHDLILTETILNELGQVLRKKFGVPDSRVEFVINKFQKYVQTQKSKFTGSLELIRDPDDRLVLASVIEARADILITGDKDFLDVRDRIPEILIKTPREFWELVRQPY